MARTRVYKLYATASAANAASLQIGKAGNIRAISWDVSTTNGADVTGSEYFQLCINAGTSSYTTNDTPGFDIDSISCGSNIASSSQFSQKSTPAIAIPVVQGDRLVLNIGTTPHAGATACSGRGCTCHVYVEE